MDFQLGNDLAELTDDEDFVEAVNFAVNSRRMPNKYRERINHFEVWNEIEFVQRFRLSKDGVRFVINQIQEEISSRTDWNHAVSAEEMVLVTLRYFATGNFLQTVGDFIGMDKGTASRMVWKVSRAIAGLYPQHVRMPQTEDELKNRSQNFYNVARFPKCIGAIDCTHVKILSPGGDDAEIYRNRKGFFSFNVQAICDSECLFQDVVCRWPGSSHDSQIFLNSNIRAKFEQDVFKDYVIVGDSGYGLKNYLITPLLNPESRGELLFNESQIRTRNCIERTFGQWKRRFPILAFGIRLSIEKVEAVVIATAVLHNICKLLNEQPPPSNDEENAAVNFVNALDTTSYMRSHSINNRSSVKRHQIINYFNNLQ